MKGLVDFINEGRKDNLAADMVEEWYNAEGILGGADLDLLFNLVAKGKDDAVIAFLEKEMATKFDKKDYAEVLDRITYLLDV